jgi:peptide/nickel transport system substrate-binding protein
VRVAALEAGEIHIADNLSTKESFDVLEADPNLVAYNFCRPGVNSGWHLNASKPPFDDIKVREAIGYLIDRETAIETLFGGFIEPYYGIISECMWSYWEGSEDYWRYNPEKGLALLEEAGWTDTDGDGMLDKDGEPFVFETFGMSEDNQIVAFEFWQATLREFGIDYQPEYAEPGVVVEQCHGAQRDACVLGWRSTDPGVMGVVFHSDNIGSGFAWSHLADEEIDNLLAAGAKEPDKEKRMQIYQDLQKRILDLYIYFPFWRLPGLVGYDAAVKDAVHLPYPQFIYIYDTYIEE